MDVKSEIEPQSNPNSNIIEDQQAGEEKTTRVVHVSESLYQGPIPDPETLARYEAIKPGLADRIVRMAEEYGTHRRSLQDKSIDAQIVDAKSDRKEARLGQIFALIIGLTAISAGTYAAVHNAQVTGSIIGGGGVIGLVSVFIFGRKKQDSDDESE